MKMDIVKELRQLRDKELKNIGSEQAIWKLITILIKYFLNAKCNGQSN
jgi:hypothetical protein